MVANILARVSRKHTNINLGQNKGMTLLGHLEKKKKKKEREVHNVLMKACLVKQTWIEEENRF